jgi:hypothetical protein
MLVVPFSVYDGDRFKKSKPQDVDHGLRKTPFVVAEVKTH